MFSEKVIIEFAAKNNWKLKTNKLLKLDTLNPTGFEQLQIDDYSLNLLKEKEISKLKPNDYKILIFETSAVSIEPGGADETYQNGFVLLNVNGTELKVFHFWGE